MKRTLSLLVENHSGVLARISGMFSGRGYNLESLTVGVTTDPTVSRITLICVGNDAEFDQIKKQLNRLIDTIKVLDLTTAARVNRELALIKVSAKHNQRGEIFQVSDVFGARIMDVGTDSMVIEISGDPQKIEDFITVMMPYNIIETARSGLVAMERGKKVKKNA
jgi:acetolactate synthase I/III small subunit